MSKDQGKFDFSCHDPFKGIVHPNMKMVIIKTKFLCHLNLYDFCRAQNE